MKRLLVAFALLLPAACSHTPTAQEVTGHWKVEDIGDHSPEDVGFRTFEMTFGSGGHWSFTSSMVDASKLGLGGEGTWTLDGGKLRCVREGTDATIGVSMRGGKLVLEPDPVIEPWNGSSHVPVITTYVRVK